MWSAPASNGSPLLAYEILFSTTPGGEPTAEDSAYCDGSVAAVVAARECTIPMSQFWLATAGSPFGFVQGDQLSLKIRASNSMGYGAYSAVLTGGPIIETVPDSPSTSPARDEAGTTTTQIAVEMEEVAALSLAAGGSTITSYNLEWNQGSGTQFHELSGETSDSLARLITVGSLTEGQTYTFRYRIKNIHGWSINYSPEV